jgi:trimeric autotransporter adhesin
MAITVKHSKVSTIPDEADTSLVRPSDWNADHTLTGTIDITNGGTGQTTANAAFNALVPSQTGNTGKYLTTDGTDTSWATNPLGTVTSVNLTASTGISVSGGPITTSGSITVTNTAPDQTVVLNSGTGISTSGTYPNFTVTNTGVTSAVAGTGISVSSGTGAVTVTNTAPDQTVAIASGTGISVSGTYPNFTVTNTSPSLGGDVVGPASATDNAIARFDTTSGKIIQNSVVTMDDTGVIAGATLTSPKINEILDSNGNEVLGLLSTASATDYVAIKNGIGTGVPLHISSEGSSTNIGLHIQPKGSGLVTISDGTDFNKGIRFRSSGSAASAITLLDAVSTSGRVVTLPDATTTLVGRDTTDTLTNKSISGSTNTLSNIGNASLTNSAITINGTSTSLGGSINVGTVTSVTGTAPVVSSGGATPAISMAQSSTTVDGYLSATDFTTFNNKGNGTVTSVAALTLGTSGTDLSSTVANGTTTPVITLQVPTASATNRGALSSADWTTFNSKAAPFTYTSTYIPFGQGTTTPNQSANLTFDGTSLTAPVQRASNGIVTNNKTIGTSFTIPSTDNAMSSGPVTLSAGVTVTVSSGSRWVVL